MSPAPQEPAAIVPGAVALRAYYFCYLAAVGVSVPFFPPYLRGLGFTGEQIGWVLALAPLMHLTGPFLWGWITDRTRRPDVVLRVALAGAAVAYLPLTLATSVVAVLLIQLCHQTFNIALPGLSDALALARVKAAGDDYGRIRLWGSFGFVVSCLVMGQVFAARRHLADPWLPLVIASLLLVALMVSLGVRGRGGKVRPKLADARRLIRDKRLLFIMGIGAVHWGCLVPYHGFFGVHVQDRGMRQHIISYAFALSVTCEIVAFFYFRHIKRRLRLSTLLVLVSALTSVRWLVTAWAHHPAVLVGIQSLHGFSFGVFWAASMAWLTGCVPENVRATGQTLYTGSVFGVGALVGSIVTGQIYGATGSAAPAFLVAASLNAAQALIIAIWGARLNPEL